MTPPMPPPADRGQLATVKEWSIGKRFRASALLKQGRGIDTWLGQDAVTGERVVIKTVSTNLLSNAIKFGQGKPIELEVVQEAGRARLSIRDQGIGIDADDQARVFERFERAVSMRHYGGMGLGLWITRQVVEAMGGTIHVTSEPGRGSTFTVEVPCAPAAARPPPVGGRPGEEAVPTPSEGGSSGTASA